MSEYSDIQVEIEDPVALIRLNRPDKLNAVTSRTLRELRSAIDAAAADSRVVGIVITGNGRGFCSGLDAEQLVRTTSGEGPPAAAPNPDELPGMFSYLLQVPKPIIAAVNGVAAGGGLILALMSDLRIASSNASGPTPSGMGITSSSETPRGASSSPTRGSTKMRSSPPAVSLIARSSYHDGEARYTRLLGR